MENRYKNFGSKWQAVNLASELGFIIAIPIVALGLLGKYLDARWGTHPYLKLAGLVLAIVSSSYWLYHRFSEVFKSLNKKENPENHDK